LGNSRALRLLRIAARDAPTERAATAAGQPRPAPEVLPDPAIGRIGDGSGHPLPEAVRSHHESTVGAELSAVRIHDDEAAHRFTGAIGANAATWGAHIYFAAGRYRPDSVAGAHLLDHELAHTVQRQARAEIHRSPDDSLSAQQIDRLLDSRVITDAYRAQLLSRRAGLTPGPTMDSPDSAQEASLYPVAEGPTCAAVPEPLGAYTELRAAISPEAWHKLALAAAMRTLSACGRRGDEAPVDLAGQQLEGGAPEVDVPLADLVRPPLLRSSAAGTLDDRLWPLVTKDDTDPAVIAEVLRDEMVSRWALDNMDLTARRVTVALIDPDGLTDAPNLLTFQLDDHPLPTGDGLLYVASLDPFGSNTLSQHSYDVGIRSQALLQAGTYHITAQKVFVEGASYAAQVNTDLAGHSVAEISAQMEAVWKLRLEMEGFSSREPAVAARIAQDVEQLTVLSKRVLAPLHDTALTYLQYHQPDWTASELYEDVGVRTVTRARENAEEGNYGRAAAGYAGGFIIAMWQGLGNLFTAGHQETKGQIVRAYRAGQVSERDMDELIAKSRHRALTIGALEVALIIATDGLAAPVLGAAPTAGATALYWAGAGAASSIITMGTESIYSRTQSFDDPTAQAIWEQRQWSPWAIAKGAAFSAGMGGFFGGMGGLLQSRAAARSLVLASEQTALGPPAVTVGDVTVEIVSPGVVRMTQQGHPGIVILDENGWRAMMPAGNGMRVVNEGVWEAGEPTFTSGFGEEGEPLTLPAAGESSAADEAASDVAGATVPRASGTTLVVAGRRLSEADVAAILRFNRMVSARLEARIAARAALPEIPETGPPVPLTGVPVPALYRYFRGRYLPPAGTSRQFELQPGFVATEATPNFPNQSLLGSVHIEEAGKFDPDVIALFEQDPVQTASALRSLARGIRPQLTGALVGHEAELASTSVLMFGLEPARNVSSLATSAMVTELAAEGLAPANAVGLYPMGPKGAMRANLPIDAFRANQRALSQFQSGKKPRQMIEKEVELMVRYTEDVLHQSLFTESMTVEQRLNELEPQIEQRLEDFFASPEQAGPDL
jgi:hypothetical protein